MDSAIESIRKSAHHTLATPLLQMFDFKKGFESSNLNVKSLLSANIIEFSKNGVRSKQDPSADWNEWCGGKSNEYFHVTPEGFQFPHISVSLTSKLNPDHLKMLTKIIKLAHLEADPFWISILGGGVGKPEQELQSPGFDFESLRSLRNEAPIIQQQLDIDPNRHALPNRPNAETQPAFADHQVAAAEVRTKSVSKSRPIKGSTFEEYEFFVIFEDGERQWLPLDDLMELDYTLNDSVKIYLNQHKQIEKKGNIPLYLFFINFIDFYHHIFPLVMANRGAVAERMRQKAKPAPGAGQPGPPPPRQPDVPPPPHEPLQIDSSNDPSDSDSEEEREQRRKNNKIIRDFRLVDGEVMNQEKERPLKRQRKSDPKKSFFPYKK